MSEAEDKEADFCIECEVNPEFAKELSEMLGIDFKGNEVIINTNILLNLIFKLQKEIERYRNSDYETICLENTHLKDLVEKLEYESIPKEAIRGKIEELIKELPLIGDCKKDCEKCFKQYRGSNFVYCYAFHQIKILKELLGE